MQHGGQVGPQQNIAVAWESEGEGCDYFVNNYQSLAIENNNRLCILLFE